MTLSPSGKQGLRQTFNFCHLRCDPWPDKIRFRSIWGDEITLDLAELPQELQDKISSWKIKVDEHIFVNYENAPSIQDILPKKAPKQTLSLSDILGTWDKK